MNERIKLPPQEWLGYDPEKGDIHGYTFEQMREFAKLIIQECAKIADSYADENLRLLPSEEMKKKFGL